MTAAPELYVREGSRFVRADQARPVPPIPTPVHIVDDAAGDDEPDERPNFTRIPAPRCPHGSFTRWATRNCCARGGAR